MNTIHLTIGKWAGLLCATVRTGESSDHPGVGSIAIAGELAPFPLGFDGQALKPNCTLTEHASQARLDE